VPTCYPPHSGRVVKQNPSRRCFSKPLTSNTLEPETLASLSAVAWGASPRARSDRDRHGYSKSRPCSGNPGIARSCAIHMGALPGLIRSCVGAAPRHAGLSNALFLADLLIASHMSYLADFSNFGLLCSKCPIPADTSACCISSPKSDRGRLAASRRSIAALSAIATSTTDAAPDPTPTELRCPVWSRPFPATPTCISSQTASRNPASLRTALKASSQAWVFAAHQFRSTLGNVPS
jgi:hypothetical protein